MIDVDVELGLSIFTLAQGRTAVAAGVLTIIGTR
jgi:hypothetical protein